MRLTNHAFVNQLLIYTLCTICVSGSIGLGTVWMRHQISLTANASSKLEARLAEVDRHLAETAALIGEQEDPGLLKRRNTELKLGLVAPAPEKVVTLVDNSSSYLAAKRNRGLLNDVPLLSLPFSAAASPVRTINAPVAMPIVAQLPNHRVSKN